MDTYLFPHTKAENPPHLPAQDARAIELYGNYFSLI